MKRLLLLLSAAFCLLLSIQLPAQKNWRPGMIITESGSELRGEINYRNWDINPNQIQFQKASGEIITYLKEEIKHFEVIRGDGTAERFRRFVLAVDHSPVKLGELSKTSEPIFETDTVLLMELVRGPYSLYYLKDSRSVVHFFLQKEDELPKELVYKKYSPNEDNDLAVSERYRRTLIEMLYECPAVRRKIETMSYNMRAMLRLMENYYELCEPSAPSYLYHPEKKKWIFYLTGGLSQNRIAFSGRNPDRLDEWSFDGSTGWIAGAGAEFPILRSNDRLSAVGEIVARNYSFYSELTEETQFRTTFESVTLEFLTLRPTLMVRYYALRGAFKAYANLGFGYEFILQEKENRYFKQIDSSTSFYEEEEVAWEAMRSHQQVLAAGLGVEVNRFGLQARWENGNGFAQGNALEAPQQSYVLLLSVRLN